MNSAILDLASALTAPPLWLTPYITSATAIVRAGESSSVASALSAARSEAVSVTFVEQAELPAGEPYEAFIGRTARVPTRDNAHDLFNGLIWLNYPHTKRRLNVLHAEQIQREGVTTARGRLRDALTLFDENAALLQASPDLTAALRARDWHTLFIKRRSEWRSARLMLFGHALLEKLMQPRKAITAHVWIVESVEDADVAASLNVERLAEKDFLPLPVLGVPGWWSANEAPEFYDDTEVFRPARVR